MSKRVSIALFVSIISGLLIACAPPYTAPTVVPTGTTAPTEGETTTEAITATTASVTDTAVTTETTGSAAGMTMTKFNLNTVTAEQILTIPNTGNRMVHEFEEYRPYISIQQFRREIGKYVDEAQVTEYENYVYVPVNINNSDAATLQQLPGVDEALATELIAGQPYASNTAFLESLAQHLSAEQVAAAEGYLETE